MLNFETVKEYNCLVSLGACFLLSVLFVSSLYVWNSPHDRNHPSTIKKRFYSVFVVMIISVCLLKQFIVDDKFKNVGLMELLGLRLSGLLSAMVFPLFLTMTLFLGPLAMQNFVELWYVLSDPSVVLGYFKNLIWLRNIVVAPISEEFTFRACMIPLLLQCFKPMAAVFICPLFFGLAHLHHMMGRLKAGDPIKMVVIRCCFECLYTTLFGAYSAFLFVRTGHFVAPLVAHSFCNIMGFPDFNKVFTYKNPWKTVLICLFFAGIILWALLLLPLTNHRLYNNSVFWTEN